MKESYWGIFIVVLGVVTISFIIFFQDVTNTDEQNYMLLKEITEAAMYDAVDMSDMSNIRINREKFVENFVRRFAEAASLANTYEIEIYDVSETPPKVSLRVRSVVNTTVAKNSLFGDTEIFEFNIDNRIDAILETTY